VQKAKVQLHHLVVILVSSQPALGPQLVIQLTQQALFQLVLHYQRPPFHHFHFILQQLCSQPGLIVQQKLGSQPGLLVLLVYLKPFLQLVQKAKVQLHHLLVVLVSYQPALGPQLEILPFHNLCLGLQKLGTQPGLIVQLVEFKPFLQLVQKAKVQLHHLAVVLVSYQLVLGTQLELLVQNEEVFNHGERNS